MPFVWCIRWLFFARYKSELVNKGDGDELIRRTGDVDSASLETKTDGWGPDVGSGFDSKLMGFSNFGWSIFYFMLEEFLGW